MEREDWTPVEITSHFEIKPNKGGSPPKERSIITTKKTG